MPKEQDFYYTAPSEGRATAQQQNPSYTLTTISPARITENTNLSDIFPFEFEANESPTLLSNAAANEQKAITAMYTEAKVEGKTIHLILDSRSAGSIITYQLMQQLKRNVDRPAQTVIVTADGMKKTPVGEIDNFLFTLDGITIPVKVLVINAPQSMSNWADETEQEHFTPHSEPKTSGWNIPYSKPEPKKQCPYILLKYMLLEECNRIDVVMREEVCDQTCQYALSISEKVKRGTPFNAAYNSAFNKLYYYSHDAEMIFDLAIALINGATKEDVCQMKETEYIEYTMELAEFDYEDEPALQLKYFNNNGQRIKPEKAHEIDAGYDLRYPGKDTLVLKPKSLTKINLKIAFKILPGAMVQITFWSSLASKRINVRGGIIDAGYTGDITVMLQNKTDKPFKIEHAEKIAQVIYLLLINISGLQLVNQREQLGKSNRGTQSFGSTGRFTVSVNIAFNTWNESHQIFRLPQPITISPFGEHPEIYTCPKPTTTQQIFESNEQVCLEHNILIPNIYILEGTKKVRVTFYNPNNYPIILLNNLEIGVIYSNIFQQELLQTVPDFSEIIGHSIPKINPNPSSENYHVVMKKLSRINMGQLEPQQQTQLKELIAEFADIFAENNNDLGRTNLVQHQIYTGDAKPRRQQAY
ncbi:hypothetical protein G9A89_014122 [Geosiphon pyriformis]|nr:hypothetical protein G9A89_014122 [Geosiphon pyriformis]